MAKFRFLKFDVGEEFEFDPSEECIYDKWFAEGMLFLLMGPSQTVEIIEDEDTKENKSS